MTVTGATSGRSGRADRPLAGFGWFVVSVATALTLLALALLPLLTPLFIHPALDASGSASLLGLSSDQVHRLSDQSVSELVIGPGTFAFAAPDGTPFYQPDEAAHLRDARVLLYLFLAAAAISAVLVGGAFVAGRDRIAAWRAVRRGAAGLGVGVVVLGVIGSFAFEPAFELFHEIFFPGGNWAFGPTSRMIRLYPETFWEIASASLGAIAVALAAATWWTARRHERGALAGVGTAAGPVVPASLPGSAAEARH